jgi:hypothetical protein
LFIVLISQNCIFIGKTNKNMTFRVFRMTSAALLSGFIYLTPLEIAGNRLTFIKELRDF